MLRSPSSCEFPVCNLATNVANVTIKTIRVWGGLGLMGVCVRGSPRFFVSARDKSSACSCQSHFISTSALAHKVLEGYAPRSESHVSLIAHMSSLVRCFSTRVGYFIETFLYTFPENLHGHSPSVLTCSIGSYIIYISSYIVFLS